MSFFSIVLIVIQRWNELITFVALTWMAVGSYRYCSDSYWRDHSPIQWCRLFRSQMRQTSFIFIFEFVPEPVWKTSTGKCDQCLPLTLTSLSTINCSLSELSNFFNAPLFWLRSTWSKLKLPKMPRVLNVGQCENYPPLVVFEHRRVCSGTSISLNYLVPIVHGGEPRLNICFKHNGSFQNVKTSIKKTSSQASWKK